MQKVKLTIYPGIIGPDLPPKQQSINFLSIRLCIKFLKEVGLPTFCD